MILVWGEANDPPVARVLAALAERGETTWHLHHAALARLRHDLRFDGGVSGWLSGPGAPAPRVDVARIGGAYVRPGAVGAGPSATAAGVLIALLSSLPARVVNRPAAGRSNHSKPYQLTLIAAAGLDVPDTLLTTAPGAARAFLRKHRRVVYKSLSGVRSIVAALDATRPEDLRRLDDVRTGPVQLQAHVAGLDVRLHVVGDRCFACAIESTAVDYRYAAVAGQAAALREVALPAALRRRLVRLTRSMDLQLAGIDLRRRADGRWFCFEVNPSPGFSWYEDATGQPIAESIAALLAGEAP